ncbi:MAG: 50S ribosomal protein L22, partial [Candidatus Micrarchaeota archaeon]
MGLYSYSIKAPAADEKKIARAQVHDVNASHKDLSQVLGAIKYKPITLALQILEDAISMKKAIPYRKFATRLGHRSELGGKKGRYPKKEAKVARELLKNAIANAEAKGLDREKLVVAGGVSHKQNLFMRHRKYWASGIIIGYGRQSLASKYVTCW